MGLLRGARKAVRECLNVKRNERVLVVTDPLRLEIGMALFRAAQEVSKDVLLAVMPTLEKHGQEPPAQIARLMRESDVVLAPTTYSITHTRARLGACMAGARVATMPGITRDIMSRGAMLADYRKVKKLTLRVARILDRGSRVRITSARGTDLRFEIGGRKSHPDTGIMHEAGDFGNLPAGEAFIAPVEESAEGIVVIDGPFAGIPESPVLIEFRNGFACRIQGSRKLLRMLAAEGKHARQLAEFGIGTNPRARLVNNVLESEKVLGTCHIALGDNSTFGGKIEANIHVDGIVRRPTVEIDGRVVLDRGRLRV